MSEHSEDCGALGVPGDDDEQRTVVPGPCSCGLDAVVAVVKAADEWATYAASAGYKPPEAVGFWRAKDAAQQALLAAVDKWRATR